MSGVREAIKRGFDVAVALAATLLLLPMAAAVGVAVALTCGRPVLYRSRRVGRNGREFGLYKFRTMVREAASIGPSITCRDDPRVTRIGRVLRRTKIDEFPQVINVLRGEMSIVGPRPECPEFVASYSDEQAEVLRVRPGLTSLAQVVYREEEKIIPAADAPGYYATHVLPRKLALDLYYVRKWSLGLDLRIFLLGVLALGGMSPRQALWPAEAAGLKAADDPARAMKNDGGGR